MREALSSVDGTARAGRRGRAGQGANGVEARRAAMSARASRAVALWKALRIAIGVVAARRTVHIVIFFTASGAPGRGAPSYNVAGAASSMR